MTKYALWPLLVVACTPAIAFGVSQYSVTLLPVPVNNADGSVASTAMGTSAFGVVGYSETFSSDGDPLGNTSQAILWQGANMITLPGPDGYLATARGINNSGDVIGTIQNVNVQYYMPVLWHDGQLQILDTAGLAAGVPHSINDGGVAVGQIAAPTSNVGQAAMWQNGQLTVLSGFDMAWAINNAGQVLVTNYTASPMLDIWCNGTLTPIASPTGVPLGGDALNNAGDVAGAFTMANGNECGAFLWKDGGATFLPNLPGDIVCTVDAINDTDLIVGSSYGATPGATLWEGGQVYNLNDLIPQDSGWLLAEATAIDSFGRIVGDGVFDGQETAFLLTPVGTVPEPASLTLLALSCAALLVRRRK